MRFRPSWMPRILSAWWLGTSRRSGQHSFGGSHRVLPEWRTQIVCHAAPPGRNNNNELLQCLFYYSGRAVPDERLLCYSTQNVSKVDGNLFRSVTQSNKCVVFCQNKCRICMKTAAPKKSDPPPEKKKAESCVTGFVFNSYVILKQT